MDWLDVVVRRAAGTLPATLLAGLLLAPYGTSALSVSQSPDRAPTHAGGDTSWHR